MAEMQTARSAKGRLSPPRVDLTPMVDLGFLLITFFMYTTTMAKPKLMELNMPYKTDKAVSEIPEESTLVVIPAAAQKYVWYRGASAADTRIEWTTSKGLRSLLLSEQQRVKNLPSRYSAQAHKLHLLIHPDTASRYEDLVNVLDEARISDVPYYIVGAITEEEAALVKKVPQQL